MRVAAIRIDFPDRRAYGINDSNAEQVGRPAQPVNIVRSVSHGSQLARTDATAHDAQLVGMGYQEVAVGHPDSVAARQVAETAG
jgi:hypothetical protein